MNSCVDNFAAICWPLSLTFPQFLVVYSRVCKFPLAVTSRAAAAAIDSTGNNINYLNSSNEFPRFLLVSSNISRHGGSAAKKYPITPAILHNTGQRKRFLTRMPIGGFEHRLQQSPVTPNPPSKNLSDLKA